MALDGSIATDRLADPLLSSAPLPYGLEVYPHGFPARVVSNSEGVLAAARQSWGGFPRWFSEEPIEVRCLVSEEGAMPLPAPPVVRAQGNLLTSVADRDNLLTCDLAGGRACIWVTRTVASHEEYLRYYFVEAAVYCLLDNCHVVSVHAACVALEGQGVLLAGDSGCGKTSLAYACARRGWTYTSDDASVVVRRSRGRLVLGNPRVLRFRASAGRLFPEFSGVTETRRGDGKPTIEVRTKALGAIRTSHASHVRYIVFLNRADGTAGRAELIPLGGEEVFRRLWWNPYPAEVPGLDERLAAVRRLSSAPGYEMRYRELDSAVDRLDQLIRGGSQ